MLLDKIMKMISFEDKIRDLKENELGIYEEKNKIKINYPAFAETFLKKIDIIKVAKKGEERFEYYTYSGTHWVLIDSDLLKGLIRKCLNQYLTQTGFIVEENLVREVFSLSARTEQVDFVNYKLNFEDCVYNFKTLEYESIDKENYFIEVKDYKKNEMNIDTPIFDKFISEIMCGDMEAVESILQFMGSCLSGMQKMEKFALFMGYGSNGKSTLIKLLSNIIGDQYVEARDINALNETFAMEGLDKIKLIISTESSSKKEVSVEMLKKLTTYLEKIYMNRKNKKASSEKLNLNLIFACNQPINFGQIDEKDKSIVRRLVVIPFNRMFEENEKDRNLDEKLKLEIPGITLKLIQAYERLAKNEYILPNSEMIEEATEEYVEKYIYKKPPNWRIKNFIDTYVEKNEEYLISIPYMYEKYREKVKDMSIKEQTFAKEIRLAMPEYDKRDPSKKNKIILDKEGKNSSKFFVGYKLKDNPIVRRSLFVSNNKEIDIV